MVYSEQGTQNKGFLISSKLAIILEYIFLPGDKPKRKQIVYAFFSCCPFNPWMKSGVYTSSCVRRSTGDTSSILKIQIQ